MAWDLDIPLDTTLEECQERDVIGFMKRGLELL